MCLCAAVVAAVRRPAAGWVSMGRRWRPAVCAAFWRVRPAVWRFGPVGGRTISRAGRPVAAVRLGCVGSAGQIDPVGRRTISRAAGGGPAVGRCVRPLGRPSGRRRQRRQLGRRPGCALIARADRGPAKHAWIAPSPKTGPEKWSGWAAHYIWRPEESGGRRPEAIRRRGPGYVKRVSRRPQNLLRVGVKLISNALGAETLPTMLLTPRNLVLGHEEKETAVTQPRRRQDCMGGGAGILPAPYGGRGTHF